MGALSSFTKWNPEDDLLLKNAVEAGASLESLAKGAVQFSQRFTIRELEERWHSLLYDLNTSTEASTRIIEIEIGVSVYNPSKLGRACNSKAKDASYGGKKGETLQCHYHTMRKKARIEPHKSIKFGFLMSSGSHAAIDNDSSLHDHFKLPNEFAHSKFHVHAAFSDNYGHTETSYRCGQHIYPKMVEVESTAPASNLAFHGGVVGSGGTKLPVGISGTDCLYGHGENISSISIDEAGFNDAGENFEPNLTVKDFPHALDRNHCSSQTSNIPGSTSTFHQLGYSSPSLGLPIWKTDVSTPTLQMDGQFEEKGQGGVTMQCINKIDDQACDNVTPKGKLNNGTSTAALNDSAILLEANFTDFPDPCMSFADDDDLLLIDVDEDDIGDGSCLNVLGSIFLSSPTSAHMDNLPIPGESKPSDAFGIPFCSDADSSVEHQTIHEQTHIDNFDLHSSVVPVACVLPSSSGTSLSAEPVEKLMICVLNTEDQDIPCNDSVSFPAKSFQAFPTTNMRQDISSTVAHHGKATSGDCTSVKEGKTTCVQPNVTNFNAGHSLLHSTVDCRLESVPSDRDLICGASTVSNKNIDDPSLIPAITSRSAPDLSLKQEATELNSEVACIPSHHELVSSELGCVDPLPSISDQEEVFESEEEEEEEDVDDVPNFSDVEAMILGMDLGSYDQESCLFTKEVSRYQCVDTKKTIIRLEQGARSYMNRAISSHGAFAIFYGRNLKYFIRNPEVLLGRETEEIKVDIDLGKEGRANKISRKQAIIMMDKDGYFRLRNIGKSSIFVNSKEVPARKRINLCSCALIEIKGMRFIFEVNELAVRRHVASLRHTTHGPKSEFDFVYN
ncbi:hypothetical protein KFK09_014586 [Dendrobium nobile]|uniref:FHA domain-containing protein n=1 Tax=Dendrobium nobile TaxID=94219 RepID=A0A8T3B3K5_DENNO|nr:hypothetical protein KFK09_014586 [Dendrobium nobile]